jgi:hypothetical protein
VTNRVTTALTAFVVVSACGPATAAAQDGGVYVGAAGMATFQDGHRQGSSPSLPTTGAGGSAIGVTVEAGGLLTPRVALGVEMSLPGRFTSTQQTDYLRVFQQESRHRDAAISGVVRGIVGSAGRARLAVVGGGGLVQESTLQRRRDQLGPLPTFPPVFGPYSEEYSFSRWTVAVVAGADVEIAVTRHVAVVPQVRAHFVRRTDNPSEQGWALGLSSVVLRPAVGIRATF